MGNGGNAITIIQGDTYECEINIGGTTPEEIIDTIYFSCNGLSVCKSLSKSLDKWVLRFEANETTKFNSGSYTYDFTIKFVDNTVQTVQYIGLIQILPKVNKVVCE